MASYHTAIVGPEDVVSGFRALGVDAYPAEHSTALLETLSRIRRMYQQDSTVLKYAVVIVTESLVAGIPSDEWERVTRGVLPAVVVLPGLEGSTGEGVRHLRRLAERAVGSDILQ
jgi:V/A-type H+/Na+-transporting ATPase subunit F